MGLGTFAFLQDFSLHKYLQSGMLLSRMLKLEESAL